MELGNKAIRGNFFCSRTYTIKHFDDFSWQDHYDIFVNKEDCIKFAEDNYYRYEITEHKYSLVAYSKGDGSKDARYQNKG